MDEKYEINIRIEGREYPVKFDPVDEEKYRLAAKRVNDTLNYFKVKFPQKDIRDKLVMTAIQLALEVSEQVLHKDDVLFVDELNNLNDDLNDYLRERKKK